MLISKRFFQIAACLFIGLILSSCATNTSTTSSTSQPPPEMSLKEKMDKLDVKKSKQTAKAPEEPKIELDAIAEARKKLAENPLDWKMMNNLGVEYMQKRQYKMAAITFKQAIEMYQISMTNEEETKRKEVQQRVQFAQKEAHLQNKRREEQARNQQLISGMFGMMALAPGGMGGAVLAQAGQTAMNAMGTHGGSYIDMAEAGYMDSASIDSIYHLSKLYINLGKCYMLLGNNDEAISAFSAAYEKNPTNKDILFMLGRLYQRDQNYAKAITQYLRFIAVSPQVKLPLAWQEVAESCKHLGLAKESETALALALDAWNEALKSQDIKEQNSQYMYGQFLASAGFYKESLPFLKSRYDENPADFRHQRDWAVALLRAGEAKEAFQILHAMRKTAQEKNIQIGNKDFFTYFYGIAKMYEGNLVEAKEILSALQPKPGQTNELSTAAYAFCGHLKETRDWIDKIEDGDETSDMAYVSWFRLACVWFANGNKLHLAECLSRSLSLEPAYGPAMLLKEKVLEDNYPLIKEGIIKAENEAAKGNAANACTIISYLISNIPRGELYDKLMRRGIQYMAKAEIPMPMSQEARDYYLKGRSILKNVKSLADYRKALNFFLWAARFSPLNQDIHITLSTIYAQIQQYQKALYHLEIYMQSIPQKKLADTFIEKHYELRFLYSKEQENLQTVLKEINNNIPGGTNE